MATTTKVPTIDQFNAFQKAYTYFNKKLFKAQLPEVILNLSRKSKAMGFAAPCRWRNRTDPKGAEGTIHELSINPEILMMSPVDVYSTLVHEQCHIWEFHNGTASRGGYHNKIWANKMVSIGLIPSDTGQPGGRMTGQHMSDYPKEGGLFMQVLEAMPEAFKLPFVSIEGDHITVVEIVPGQSNTEGRGSAQLQRPVSKKNKTKYSCPECKTNVWGKPELNLVCGDCGCKFVAIA